MGKKVLLISSNRIKGEALYPLGLGYIHASLVAKGFEAGILDFVHIPFQEDICREYLCNYNPSYIGISIRNLDNCCYRHPISFVPDVEQIVKWIWNWDPDIKIILGGSAFTLLPKQWLSHLALHYGIIGDGTESFPRLVQFFENGGEIPDMKGTVYYDKNMFIIHRDSHADFFLNIHASRDAWIHPTDKHLKIQHNVLGKRGCRYHCTFCAYQMLDGNSIITREPKDVVEEILEMQGIYNIKSFDFVDSEFNAPRHHAEEVCRRLIEKKAKVTWRCFLHPHDCDIEFTKLMKKAGCIHAELGIDTAAGSMLKSMKKGFSKEEIKQCINACMQSGLPFNVCLLFGAPGETIETVKETFSFMDELKVKELFGLNGIRLLPKTEVCKQTGMEQMENDMLFPKFYYSEHVTSEEVIQEFKSHYQEKYRQWLVV